MCNAELTETTKLLDALLFGLFIDLTFITIEISNLKCNDDANLTDPLQPAANKFASCFHSRIFIRYHVKWHMN